MSRTVQQLFDLHGKTALVTGGSRGLGLQLAEALGEAGARVLLTSRKLSDLEEAAAHLRERGIEAEVIAASPGHYSTYQCKYGTSSLNTLVPIVNKQANAFLAAPNLDAQKRAASRSVPRSS